MRLSSPRLLLIIAALAIPTISSLPQSEAGRVRTKTPKVSSVAKSKVKASRLDRRKLRNTTRANALIPKKLLDVTPTILSKGKGNTGYRVAIERFGTPVRGQRNAVTKTIVKLQPGSWVNAGSGKDVSYRVGISKQGKALTEYRFTGVGGPMKPSAKFPQVQNNALFGVLLSQHQVQTDGSVLVSGYAWRPQRSFSVNGRNTAENSVEPALGSVERALGSVEPALGSASPGIKTSLTGVRTSTDGATVTAGRVHFTGVIPKGASSFSLGTYGGHQVDVQLGASGLEATRVVVAE